MKIDAHVHFWELKGGHGIWSANKIGGLQRDFTPEMLKPLCNKAGIDGVIIVQAAKTPEETRYMMRLAVESDFIKGIVGWLNLEDNPSKLHNDIETLKTIPKLCGIRAHPPKEFDPSWFTEPAVKESYRAVADVGLPVDFLANCTQLNLIHDLLTNVPEMTAVINHGGRPFVMTGELGKWRANMQKIARDTSAFVKLSGLIERAGVEWEVETLRPWVEAMIEDFGCERLMFASNWPVMTLMGTYDLWTDALNEILERMGASATQKQMLMGGTAEKVYRLREIALR